MARSAYPDNTVKVSHNIVIHLFHNKTQDVDLKCFT